MTTLSSLALAAFLAAAPGFDTVLLQNGGRLVGTVVEENPATGVTVQIPGGQLRTIPPAEVFRIEYRDGSFGVVGEKPKAPPAPEAAAAPLPPAPPAPAAAAAAPLPPAPPDREPPPPPPPMVGPGQAVYPAVPVGPPSPPPPPPWAHPPPVGRPAPFMLAMGMGIAVPGGNATPGEPMSDVTTTQFLLAMEGGLRFTPHVMGSLVLDLGLGDSAGPARDRCRFYGGNDCTTISARIGLQLRYAFTPLAPSTPWVSVGTAAEVGTVSYDSQNSSSDVTYSGWEALRLGAGVDFRSQSNIGWGLFVLAGFGRYSEVDDAGNTVDIHPTTSHSWVQAGVRIILFP